MDSFIDRLELALKDHCVTKTQMASILNIRRENLSTWARTGTIPSADTVLKIAKYLNVSYEWLITGEDNSQDNAPLLSREEYELLEMYRTLPDESRSLIFEMIKAAKKVSENNVDFKKDLG